MLSIMSYDLIAELESILRSEDKLNEIIKEELKWD